MDLEANTNILERKFANITSYLYWGGFMNRKRDDLYKYIFKSLNLEKYCDDQRIIDHFTDIDKNKKFFEQYKDDEEFCKYACKYIMKATRDKLLLS